MSQNEKSGFGGTARAMPIYMRFYVQILFLICLQLPAIDGFALSCKQVFQAEDSPLKPRSEIEKIIEGARRSHSSMSIDSSLVRPVLDKMMTELSHAKIAPEFKQDSYFGTYLPELALETVRDLKALLQLATVNPTVDVGRLYQASYKFSLVLDTTLKTRESLYQLKVQELRSKGQTWDEKALRADVAKRQISKASYSTYNHHSIQEASEGFTEKLRSNPSMRILVTFLPMSEIDLYHLVKKRIFVIGLTTKAEYVDEDVKTPAEFLIHDGAHLNSFIGNSSAVEWYAPAAYELKASYFPNAEARARLWLQLDRFFGQLEDKVEQGLADGKIRHRQSAERYLFQISHETSGSVYTFIEQRPDFLTGPYVQGIILSQIPHQAAGKDALLREVQEDLNFMLGATHEVFKPVN